MPTCSRTLSLIAVSALAMASASAADVTINDVRGHIGTSLTEDGELRGQGDTVPTDLDTLTLTLQYVRSIGALGPWGGVIYGGDLFFASGEGDIMGAIDMDTTAFGIDAYLGYACVFTGLPVHIEANPFIGVGSQKTRLTASPDTQTSNDTLIQYGIRVAGYHTWANQAQLGLELRYLISSETESDLLSTEVEVENSGLTISIGGGHRF